MTAWKSVAALLPACRAAKSPPDAWAVGWSAARAWNVPSRPGSAAKRSPAAWWEFGSLNWAAGGIRPQRRCHRLSWVRTAAGGPRPSRKGKCPGQCGQRMRSSKTHFDPLPANFSATTISLLYLFTDHGIIQVQYMYRLGSSQLSPRGWWGAAYLTHSHTLLCVCVCVWMCVITIGVHLVSPPHHHAFQS